MKQLWNDFVSFMRLEAAKAGFAYQSESSQQTSSNSASLLLKLSRQMQFTDELSRALASTVCHTHIHARWQYRCGNRSAMSNIWSISALAEQLVCGRLIRKGGTLGTETLIRHQLCMKIGTLHRSQGWLCFLFPTLFIQMQDRWTCNSSGNPFFPQTHSIF